MTIWNVSSIYHKDNTISYIVLPYDLMGTISTYLKYGKLSDLFCFLKYCRIKRKSADKLVEKLTNKIKLLYRWDITLYRENEENCPYTITNIPANNEEEAIEYAKNFVAENGFFVESYDQIIDLLIVKEISKNYEVIN